ncbi:MAG TPA: polysaccharide deacetylase family protein, partial [Bryobacteraceae bacterium]|nr:polysaccharide deacetylase family protein [Bryobacteraceae bacterium]
MAISSIARRALKFAWIYCLFATGALRRAKKKLQDSGALVVLTFHRILPEREYLRTSSQPGIVVREATFSSLVRYLRESCELADLHSGPPTWSARALRPRLALTFDDGWKDNFTTAFPILQRSKAPWVVFVCPGLENRPFPFWPEQVMARRRPQFGAAATDRYIEHLKTLPPAERDAAVAAVSHAASLPDDELLNATMTWAEMRSLHQSGVALGSHTDTHQILTQLDDADVQAELKRSKEALEDTLKVPCVLFAYPNGNVTEAVRNLVAAAGYQMAFST